MDFENSLKEYANPVIYDLENQELEPERTFFLEYARQLRGPVLETGCGTGRLTIPLAESGVDITGIDIVPAMIEQAKKKTGHLPIRWVIADIRSFDLGMRFGLIFETGSVFHHLLTRADQEAYLARVHEHLEENGRFIFSLIFPHSDVIVSDETEKDWFSYQDENGHTIRVSGTEHYDPIRQVKLETAIRRWTSGDGKEIITTSPLSLRYCFPQEIEALLYYNGFEIEDRFSDCEKHPLTTTSRIIILVCKKRKV
jgi:SAM-dependent methyltransferase